MVERRRRVFVVVLLALFVLAGTIYESLQRDSTVEQTVSVTVDDQKFANAEIDKIEIKGRAPKTGYSRGMFGSGWAEFDGCDTRNIILKRDLTDQTVDQTNNCHVLSGKLNDPYTGMRIDFVRGAGTSSKVQIDHVVALSDSWQKGAQNLSEDNRIKFANDPLNLLAVDGPANQKKGDGDAATWLPPHKDYRCRYVARQIAVKVKYMLWATKAEIEAMKRILSTCPAQLLPVQADSDEPG